jgi:tRNA 2-thiouridine synthesizing protein A
MPVPGPSPELEVDARGHRCPTPTLRLRRALEGLDAGDIVTLLADDPLARIDVPHFVREAGHDLLGMEVLPHGLHFRIRKA